MSITRRVIGRRNIINPGRSALGHGPDTMHSLRHRYFRSLVAIILSGLFVGCSNFPPSHSVQRTVSRIASTEIIGLTREPTRYCAPPVSDSDSFPKAIAVADPALLDDLCILGFSQLVVYAGEHIPEYLHDIYPQLDSSNPKQISSNKVLKLTTAGHNFDPSQHVESSPESIRTITHTSWKERLKEVAHVLKVDQTATIAEQSYNDYAKATARQWDTKNYEISWVTFYPGHPGTISLAGTTGFVSGVLADSGVHRPHRTPVNREKISLNSLPQADADLIYISYPPEGIDYMKSVVASPQWAKLGAAWQRRQFIINYSWWNEGQGLIAARSILDDVRDSLHRTS